MNDLRKKYIITICGNQFNLNDVENSIDGESKLEQFLDGENCCTLCAVKNADLVQFHNEVVSHSNRMIIFYKTRPSRIDQSNVYDIVQLIVLQGSATAALYHTLHNVFTPLLVQEGKKTNAVNINLQRQLTTFQSSLRSAAFAADNDIGSVSEPNSLSVISTLEHEVEYWHVLTNSNKSTERASGAAFRDILKPLARDFSMLDALQLLEVEDALEGAHNVLDDLWRHDPPYPRHRMQHLMDLIASDVIHCITRQLSDVDVWNKDYTSITDILEQSISVGKKWSSTCTHLTQLFWPNYSLHPWSGDCYTPPSLLDLVKRLEEVLSLRALHRQLVQLLTQSELQDLRTMDMFKPFNDLNILQCGPYSEASWRTAVKQFEYLLQPAEQRVAEKLKIQFASVSSNTRQLLYEFRRYTELMDRPVVRRILIAERQNLLVSLGQYVRQLADMTTSEKGFSRFDTPQIIIEINHIRMLESKTLIIQQTAEKLLNDLSGFEDLQVLVSDLLKDLKHQHSELFDSWTRELTLQINNKSLSLKETDPVVQFSSAQLMRVNYSPRLVTLVREYRQLTAMGYRIPSHIEQTAVHAKQFMKYAKALEQVANFHNTIGDRMIESQRPMMLSGALELSRLVQQQEVVSWGDVRSVEKYVESLRSAVNRLSRDNNLLASYNAQLKEKIAELSDVDLIRHLQKWKDAAKHMRDVVGNVEKQGFSNMQSWKLDIDRAFAAEFEQQYRNSLKRVHLHLPEIYVDLVYRDSKLQFNPSQEKLHEKYQHQLKRFLELPKSFRGITDITEGSVFAEIIDRCRDLFLQVEKHTEELLERLHGVIDHWQAWTSLGTLDTTKLVTWEHWDLNFRASKTFGQEVAKLPSTEERVGCFVVCLSSLRSDLESHNRSYWSQLVASLQESVAQDVVILQQYVNSSTATLTKQPLTMEQIGQAHASHLDILKQRPEMQQLFDSMINKNKTLASWTRERVDSVARLQAAWERLESLVDNHQHLISKQVEGFKSTIHRTCENLNGEIERFALHWEQFKPRPGSGQIATDSLKNLELYLATLREKKLQWSELLKEKEGLQVDCDKFGVELPDFPLCEQVQVDMEKEEKIWLLFEEFNTDLEKLSKEEWIVFRKKSYRLEEFVTDWQKRLESSEATALATRLLQELQKYENVLPVLKYVRGEDFTDKHWMEIFALLEMTAKPIDMLTLQDFLLAAERLAGSGAELRAICKRAASEVVVRQALAELDQWEVQTRFTLAAHVDSQHSTIMLIKDFKEILNKIGDNQCLLQSVKNSADYESFSERAGLWETRLVDLDHYLCSLSQIQRKWVYLEPIFGSGTLRQERARFDRLDRDFRHVLSAVERDTRVTSLGRYPNVRSLLDTLQDQLSRCQNSLDDFLKEKRLKFPRFLFLGDEDLLEILGQSSREQVIQAHLKKLFAGIHSIKMDPKTQAIEAMCSLQGETVPLSTSVNINCPVEEWLNELVTQMQDTLRKLLLQCLADGQQGDVGADPLRYPAQVLCLADSIVFTTRCEQAIRSATLPPLLATYKNQLKHYSAFKLATQKESNVDSLSNASSLLSLEDRENNMLNLKLKALMLDTIHHVDVIEDLINFNVTSLNDWYWQRQLRFYNSNDGSLKIRMVNAEFNYSYEYLGNENKLVRTPLTDKCFLTLTQGMHLGMGGNPYGPAGTGKTETVKALGGLLGRQVLVFNCDEGVDATSMGQILSGLVQSGAWGCFDEFNRLDEATLSAVSMFIQPIQAALRTKSSTVTILQRDINVNSHCGVFVTLNPTGGGYLGRNRLPDNLKQLFRPVVMSHPDHEQIANTLLRCDGFQNADVIGHKLVEVFTVASELLSQQLHYDWGLRALKTVVNTCGNALSKARQSGSFSDEDSLRNEMELVVQSLRVNTLSKLTFSDSSRLDALVRDVFLDVPFVNTGLETLSNLLEESCAELGLQVNNRQISKCIELYEQLQQRMGVTIVGPSGSGKSTLRKLLLNALSKMKRSITQHVFNPKAIPRAQLLGHIDLDTRQWTDGVLTLCAQQVYSEPAEVHSWIVCDGDVDPEWVESLNSVLDDNRLLTLPSGWRIQFGPNVNFIFETHNLDHASPATVSRMGIVFMSEEDLNLNDIVSNWLEKQQKENVQISSYLINEYFFKAVNWVKTEGDLTIPCSQVAIVQTGLAQLTKVSSKSHFTIALISGLGGLLNRSSAEIFAQKIFEWTGEHCPDENNILQCYYNAERDLIDVHYCDNKCQITSDFKNELPLILTGQVIRTLGVLRPWLSEGSEEHLLLVGPHGSAKSLMLDYLVKEQHNMELATIYCSANISPQYVLHKLSEHCIIVNSNRGRVYRPKKGRLVLYFKGLQLLKSDRWNTNMLVAFLHQLITYGGLYDSNLEWVGLECVTIVCSLTSTDRLSSRFVSLMKIHSINLPTKEDLSVIFESYLSAVIKSIVPDSAWLVKSKMSTLTTTMITIYEEVQNTFTLLQCQHYVFSPHVLTMWCTSLMRYKTLMEMTDSENGLLEVICYEARRLFCDRLVNDEDKTKFESILSKFMQLKLGKSVVIDNLKGIYYVPTDSYTDSSDLLPLVRLNSEDWISMVKKGITYFEREGQSMDLLIISELLSLSSTIARALSSRAGCALLAGRSGAGRRSALRIVAALQGARLITPAAGSPTQFKIDLKSAMQLSGVEGQHVYFLIEDHMIHDNDILNTVSTLLVAGEVPGLYSTSELDSLVAGLRDEAEREDFVGNVIQYFNTRVRNKLHLVLCLEIDGSEFWQTLENCPALYQKCTVIWQSEWSSDTMTAIPNLWLRKLSENKSEDGINLELPGDFYTIHRSIKPALASPRRYMSFIDAYINLYSDKTKIILQRQAKLKSGITKLTDAKQVVAELKVQALEQQENLAEKQSKANAALDMISATMRNANVHKQEMEILKVKTEKENEQLVTRKHEIELELAEVEPILQEARAAVGNIKTEALSEIRSLRAPPDVIRDILEGVLRLMGTQDTSWNSMKTFLSKRGVKEDIRSFDAARIGSENRQAVERLLASRSESFDPKAARRASVAAAPLASWVIANVRYSSVVDKIRPLEREQHKLQENLTTAEAQIRELSAGLTDVDTKVAQLKNQLSTYTKEAAGIEINLTVARDKLASAEGLVAKLNEEYERWGKQFEELTVDLNTLPMKCLLTAAFVSYLSEEFEDARRLFLEKWASALLGENYEFTFEEFLSTEREQFQWQSEGLLSDKLSLQNAAIILKSKNRVLLLDPSSLALQWLQKHLKHRNVEVLTADAPRFNTSLELAMRFGKVLIVTEVESIPHILLPILRNEFVYQGERKLVLLGNKLVDYHNDFLLYLSSRNALIQIPPDAYAVLNIVNFTTTKTGLTEQLLSAAIHQEYPDLQTQKSELLQKQEDLQEQQYNLQNQLLEELANATGDILQNKQLLSFLNETKASSIAISSALGNLKEVQQKLQTECDVFRPLSMFGSELYFSTTDLMKINIMYAISITAFIRLFIKALSQVESAQNDSAQTQKILLKSVYCFISRGMLKADRLLFLLHLCHHMFPRQIPEQEWKLFLGHSKSDKTDTAGSSQLPAWIAPVLIQSVRNFQNAIPDLYNSLKLDEYLHWEKFYTVRECEVHFPKFCSLTSFQQLLVVQMLRPDRLHSVMCQCVLHLTGMTKLSPGNLYLSQVLKETVNTEPVLIINGPGADPSSELRDLAVMAVGNMKYTEISMGEGQEMSALKALDDASRAGRWVCLKNLHLVTCWLPVLSQKIQSLEPHEEFRLWLITEPHQKFSSVLTQSCLKIAYETPQGIKNNLLRSYATWDSKYIQKQSGAGARLLFVLAYVHALLQERRTYAPQGWSQWYEFSDLDLYTAASLAEQLLAAQGGPPLWGHMRGLCGDAVYGGRVDDRQDDRVLAAYLRRYFQDAVLGHRWQPRGFGPLPAAASFQEYVDAVKRSPDADDPSSFGLPPNVDRAWQKNTSAKLISSLTALHVSKEKNEKLNQQLLYQNLTTLLTFWKKLNKGQEWLHNAVPKDTNQGAPLIQFINDEKRFSLNLIQSLHKSLSTISRIVRGTALPSSADAAVTSSLSAFQTPSHWLAFWSGPTEPYKYLQAVTNKTAAISKWDVSNDAGDLLKDPINLSNMFHPITFLAALKQHTSRALSVPMNELKLANIWTGSSRMQHCISLTGLLIEGAVFDGHTLSSCLSDTDSVTSTPDCLLAWIPESTVYGDGSVLKVPLYYSTSREKQITTMHLPSTKQQNEEWILAGVALFLEH